MKKFVVALTIPLFALLFISVGCTATPPAQGYAGLVMDGGTLMVPTADGQLLALDPGARATAAPFPAAGEWSYAVTTETRGSFGCGTSEVPSVLYGTPVVTDGRVCIGTYDGRVLMLEVDSRATNMLFPQIRAGEWQYPRTDEKIGPVVGSPTIVGDIVYVASSVREGSKTHGVVYALDRLFGDELWVSEPLDGKLWVTPAVVDGVVYVSTFDGRVYSLDAATGKTLPWVFQNEFGFVSSPAVVDGVLYVGSFDRRLNAVPLGAAEAAWRFQAGNWFWATPLVVEDVVYAPSLDGTLYALDAATGTTAWGTPYVAGEALAASPVRAGDSLVLVTKKGDVHVVNLATGLGARVPNPANEKATTCNAEVVATPCYHEGIVYLRAQNNTLYAIDPVSRTLQYTFSLKME